MFSSNFDLFCIYFSQLWSCSFYYCNSIFIPCYNNSKQYSVSPLPSPCFFTPAFHLYIYMNVLILFCPSSLSTLSLFSFSVSFFLSFIKIFLHNYTCTNTCISQILPPHWHHPHPHCPHHYNFSNCHSGGSEIHPSVVFMHIHQW